MVLYLGQIHGDFNIGAERFQHSLAWSNDGISDQPTEADTFRDQVAQSLVDSTLLADLNSVWRYTHVTVAEVLSQGTGPDGKPTATLAAATTREFSTPLAGSHPERPLPPQCAVVISFKADPYPNGSPVRGRMYMPAPPGGLAISSLGGLLANIIADYGAFAAALIGGMNSDLDLRTCGVWSRKTQSLHPINGITVGDRIDTVRSRREALKETYTEFSFSTV